MLTAWMTQKPDATLKEIEMAMVQIGADKKLFKFKSITPIHPNFDKKLTDESFYNNKLWNLKVATKEEKI